MSHHTHTFAICAYKESKYLEKCIISVVNQTIKSNVIMCTSTHNEHIQNLAEKYNIPLYVNPNRGDILTDWNFAYNHAKESDYITLAHQDDVYHSDYVKSLFRFADKYDDILIYYTNYYSLKTVGDFEDPTPDINSKIRAFISTAICNPRRAASKRWKTNILRFGNSICCSSVTYCSKNIGKEDVFDSDYRYCIDWDMFLKLAKLPGRFVFNKERMSYFRIHENATSSECIDNGFREIEDYNMFCQMWPKPIAKLIMIFYKAAYKNYK